jgi:hypothetical protein
VQGCDVLKETDKDAEQMRKYVDAVLGMLDPMTRSAKAQEPVSFSGDLASCTTGGSYLIREMVGESLVVEVDVLHDVRK